MKKYILVYDGMPIKIYTDRLTAIDAMKAFDPVSDKPEYPGIIAAKQTELKGLYVYEKEEE